MRRKLDLDEYHISLIKTSRKIVTSSFFFSSIVRVGNHSHTSSAWAAESRRAKYSEPSSFTFCTSSNYSSLITITLIKRYRIFGRRHSTSRRRLLSTMCLRCRRTSYVFSSGLRQPSTRRLQARFGLQLAGYVRRRRILNHPNHSYIMNNFLVFT